jgi:ferredoxin
MKITVDAAKCSGHAQCNAMAPAVYPLDDLGYSAADQLEVPPELQRQAQDGAFACPERAITVR